MRWGKVRHGGLDHYVTAMPEIGRLPKDYQVARLSLLGRFARGVQSLGLAWMAAL